MGVCGLCSTLHPWPNQEEERKKKRGGEERETEGGENSM